MSYWKFDLNLKKESNEVWIKMFFVQIKKHVRGMREKKAIPKIPNILKSSIDSNPRICAEKYQKLGPSSPDEMLVPLIDIDPPSTH